MSSNLQKTGTALVTESLEDIVTETGEVIIISVYSLGTNLQKS